MSFQTNTIWSNNEFTSSSKIWNNLVLLDNIDDKKVCVVSNLEGDLHVFKEHDNASQHVICSKFYKQPILRSGKAF